MDSPFILSRPRQPGPGQPVSASQGYPGDPAPLTPGGTKYRSGAEHVLVAFARVPVGAIPHIQLGKTRMQHHGDTTRNSSAVAPEEECMRSFRGLHLPLPSLCAPGGWTVRSWLIPASDPACPRASGPPGLIVLPAHTWYVLSNLSYMKRVMIEVFPTLWSPKKTSLYFASGGAALPDAMAW
jgi:hypothetical protein